jgi:hypothetical protein
LILLLLNIKYIYISFLNHFMSHGLIMNSSIFEICKFLLSCMYMCKFLCCEFIFPRLYLPLDLSSENSTESSWMCCTCRYYLFSLIFKYSTLNSLSIGSSCSLCCNFNYTWIILIIRLICYIYCMKLTRNLIWELK